MTQNTNKDKTVPVRVYCIGVCVWLSLISISYYTVQPFIPALCILGGALTGIWYRFYCKGVTHDGTQ